MKPLIVTALAAFLVPAAPVFLPKPADLSGTLNRFISSERQLQQRYDGLVKQAREGRLHDPAFASLLEESVIGPWSQARRQLSAAQHWSPPQQKVIDLFIRYATEREEAWKSRVVSLRGHDAKALEESKSHWAESERLVEQINHLP